MSKQESDIATETTDVQSLGSLSARILEDYLTELKAIHGMGGGVAETSYYPALSTLFNTIGKALKPKVRCVMNLRNLGAGMPDGGLFTSDQFQRHADGAPKAGQLPSRGAIEAKGTKPEVKAIAASRQVKEYLKTYGIVIVTNLREFLIVERGASGQPVGREGFALAGEEKDFWQHKAAHPRAIAQQKGAQFIEFIKRACLHAAPLTNPKDVAWFIAGWGHKGKDGVTMPAKGKLAERNYDEAEAKALDAEATARGMSAEDIRRLLGERTLDVYLNGAAYWRNVPVNVWEYYIGGYQVIKKWLSYREDEILGRGLKPEEAREVMNMARRLAAMVLMQPVLDKNYQSVKATAYAWPTQAG